MKKFQIYLILALTLLVGCEKEDEPEPEQEVDNIPPIALCKDTTLYLMECNTVNLKASEIDGGSSDNIGIDTMWLDRYTFSCEDTGSIQSITLNMLDTSDNYASCTANVTVIDTTPKPDPYDELVFSELVDLMGSDSENVLTKAPGMIFIDTTSLGERQITFLFSPTNIEIEPLLFSIYEFTSDQLTEILIADAGSVDDRELIYQMSILSETETWFSSSFHAIKYYEGYTEIIETFETAGELWRYVVSENISKGDIVITASQWDNKENELTLGYLGGYDDFGIAGIEPYEAKKSAIDIEYMFEKLKTRIKE